MKKRMKKRMLACLLPLLLCGCGQTSASAPEPPASSAAGYDPFALPAEDSAADRGGFYFGLAEPAEALAYRSPMTLGVQVGNNSAQRTCFGVMLFVDGMVQTLRPAGDAPQFMAAVQLEGGETRCVDLDLIPETDSALTAHSVRLGLVYAPDLMPEQANTAYGHSHRLQSIRLPLTAVPDGAGAAQCFPQMSSRPLTETERRRERYRSSLENGTDMLLLESGDAVPVCAAAGDALTVRMIAGSRGGTWRVSLLCGETPAAAFDGSLYADMTLAAGETAELSCMTDALPAGENRALYAVAVPLDTDAQLKQSNVITWNGGAP